MRCRPLGIIITLLSLVIHANGDCISLEQANATGSLNSKYYRVKRVQCVSNDNANDMTNPNAMVPFTGAAAVFASPEEVNLWLKDASGTTTTPPKLTPGKSLLTWVTEVQAWTLYASVDVERWVPITASLAFEPNSERREQAMAWLRDNLQSGRATQKPAEEVKNPDSGEVVSAAQPSGLELFLNHLRVSWGLTMT